MVRYCLLGHAQSLFNPVLGYAEAVHADVPHYIWVLSFGHEARLIRPDWLVEKVPETVTRQFEAYGRKE